MAEEIDSLKTSAPWPLSAVLTVGATVLAAVTFLVFWLLDVRLQGGPYDPAIAGSVADWISSFLTLLAILGTIYMFRREFASTRKSLRQTELQIRMAEAEADEQKALLRRRQASQVTGWVFWAPVSEQRGIPQVEALISEWTAVRSRVERIDQPHSGPDQETLRRFRKLVERFGEGGPTQAFLSVLVCQNLSREPVYRIEARIYVPALDGNWEKLPPFRWAIWPPDRETLRVVLRRGENEPILLRAEEYEAWCSAVRVEIEFIDASGVAWLRDRTGLLQEADEKEINSGTQKNGGPAAAQKRSPATGVAGN